MTELVKYEAAKFALSEAKAVDEVKHIHDVSAAMKAYAKQAKDKQMEIDACEIRIRAERRLGEMIRHQKETVGLANGGDATRARYQEGTELNAKPTLQDVGISKKLSSRSQQIASIPENEFEETLAEHREQQQAVTARTMDTLAKKGKEHEQKEVKETLKEALEPSEAMTFAEIAISQLERIREEDPKQKQAIKRVFNWTKKQLSHEGEK